MRSDEALPLCLTEASASSKITNLKAQFLDVPPVQSANGALPAFQASLMSGSTSSYDQATTLRLKELRASP